MVNGDSGVGKTRLVATLMKDARTRQMFIGCGQAFPVEGAIPFGVIVDALVPALHGMDKALLAVLTRGTEAELQTLLPGLAPNGKSLLSGVEGDARTRLFWTFVQFLKRLAERPGVLLVAENIQWADASSLELLHFLARQIGDSRILLTMTYRSAEHDANPTLCAIERSLGSARIASVRTVQPLTRIDLTELLHRMFGTDPAATAPFVERLHAKTLGNPFFVEETLKTLVAQGQVRTEGERWIGWDTGVDAMPATVRAAVSARIEELSPAARRTAEVAAVIGTVAWADVLSRVAELRADDFVRAIEELTKRQILVELPGEDAGYVFAHPIVQSVVLQSLSAALTRLLHGRIADELEQYLGSRAMEAAPEIARHLVRARSPDADSRALKYLIAAGRDAFQKRADREAVDYLSKSVDVSDALGGAWDASDALPMLEELARACERIGQHERASTVWARAAILADMARDDVSWSRITRRQALASAAAGRTQEALHQLATSEQAARRVGRLDMVIRVRIAMGVVLQSSGLSDEAQRVVEEVVPDAESSGDPALLARVHRALLLLYGWTGPADVAHRHAEAALMYAQACRDDVVAWSARWALAFYAGITGNGAEIAKHLQEAERLAKELRSPVLHVWTSEIAIEYASCIGDWTEGLMLAERITPVARAIAPTTVLPRLLVWTGIVRLARDEVAEARALFDEAWQLSGLTTADEAQDTTFPPREVHNAIIAHTGMAAYHLHTADWKASVEFGKRGLAIADRYRFHVWAIHRLLPIIAESALWLQDFELAEAVRDRLQAQSEMLGHRLGLAWAAGIDALLARLRLRDQGAVARLLAAADALDSIPFVFHAARMRRFAASLLETDDDRERAIRELRKAHEVFARLGAEFELRATRSQLRSLGVRLPPRRVSDGTSTLTDREKDIVRMVVRRKSNKEIATALDISPRTVSTHLSNIFTKVSVQSRGELADLARDDRMLSADL